MRLSNILPAATALAAVLVLSSVAAGASSGLSTRGGPTKASASADVSSLAAIERYLRTQGYNPARFVVQRGARNYAGPNCPSKRWNCTTARRVIQLARASAAGSRSFAAAECATPCVIVQNGTNNNATCSQAKGESQLCDITQSGAANTATVSQTNTQTAPVKQAIQKALVKQTSTGGDNSATITQSIKQTSVVKSSGGVSGAITQRLRADQLVDVQQVGSGAADNTVTTTQTLEQSATATTTGATTPIQQRLNDADIDTATARTTSAVIDQTSDTGDNTVTRNQEHTLKAKATAVKGNIAQFLGSAAGGMDGSSDDNIHQSSTGLSTSTNNQKETLTADAFNSPPGTVTQVEHGPMGCCSEQTSNPDNTFTLDQDSTLTANANANANANADQASTIEGDTASSGTTTVSQDQTINGDTTSNSCTATSGEECTPTVTCSGGDCSTAGGDITITLTWTMGGANDLDLHVILPTSEEVYYAHPCAPSASGCDWAVLDHDDVTAPGDETVTIKRSNSAPSGSYTIFVDDFSCSPSQTFVGTNATVTISGGASGTFVVSDAAGSQSLRQWNVATLNLPPSGSAFVTPMQTMSGVDCAA
jgi:hypothetical protein